MRTHGSTPIANDNILIDQGSTTKLGYYSRTDGTNTVYLVKQVDDEPFQPTYIIIAQAIPLSTANSHILAVMAGASLKVLVRRITVTQVANANAIAQTSMRLFRLSTAGSGGGALTPALYDTADAAAGATALTLNSSKGTETTQVSQRRWLIHTTATTIGLLPLVWDFRGLRTKGLVIPTGTSNGLALKNVSSDTTATVDVEMEIAESPYS